MCVGVYVSMSNAMCDYSYIYIYTVTINYCVHSKLLVSTKLLLCDCTNTIVECI